MKVRITNVPVRGFASVDIDVVDSTQETLMATLRGLSDDKIRIGFDTKTAEIDEAILDTGWNLAFEEIETP